MTVRGVACERDGVRQSGHAKKLTCKRHALSLWCMDLRPHTGDREGS